MLSEILLEYQQQIQENNNRLLEKDKQLLEIDKQRHKLTRQIAREMLRKGLDTELIASLASLPLAEVKDLQKS